MNYTDTDDYRMRPIFLGIEDGEYRTLYFKDQRVLRYGSHVNDLFFYTQVEVEIASVGNFYAVVALQVPYEFENEEYARRALCSVSADALVAVV